ncbi:MAG: hypothetical protein LBD99_03105 [Candidatus Margulisbacteria bacterium]|jgi:hypothetical protein|nr:hypothetical protein [Candidatus Margulisiibacteriota bacterium]
MQTKLIKYIEEKYPGYTAKAGIEHQAYTLEILMAKLTSDDLARLREERLILVKTATEKPKQAQKPSEQERILIEFIRKRYDKGIPPETVAETTDIILARGNLTNPLAFFLCNCGIFLEKGIRLNTPYKFYLIKNTFNEANFLTIFYKSNKYSVPHRFSELLLQQTSEGEHEFIFYLNADKEIGMRIDGTDFSLPEPLATSSQP